ncbi:MAG: YdcF family protein [Ardenticatenaceae bacterium]|nr:YdcF family protein [Ardenticatenaceae bacterium]
MFIFLSKFLPVFVYPLGITILLIVTAVFVKKRPYLQRALLITAVLILWLSSTRPVAFALTRSLEQQYRPPAEWPAAEAIVVLGSGAEPQVPPRTTVEVNKAGDRELLAAQLYRQGKADKIVVTGGVVPWLNPEDMPSGADSMAALLQILDVPPEALVLETQSRNTYENALFTRQILAESGEQRILLVTSATHMPRSVRLFTAQGFTVIPAAADFQVTDADWRLLFVPDLEVQLFNWLPEAGYLHMTTTALKEYVGLLVYGWQGWL